eukprot:71495-Prymnesium_polylepis.1
MIFSSTTGSRVTSSTIHSGSGWAFHVRRHRFPEPPPDRQSKHVNLAAKQGASSISAASRRPASAQFLFKNARTFDVLCSRLRAWTHPL